MPDANETGTGPGIERGKTLSTLTTAVDGLVHSAECSEWAFFSAPSCARGVVETMSHHGCDVRARAMRGPTPQHCMENV